MGEEENKSTPNNMNLNSSSNSANHSNDSSDEAEKRIEGLILEMKNQMNFQGGKTKKLYEFAARQMSKGTSYAVEKTKKVFFFENSEIFVALLAIIFISVISLYFNLLNILNQLIDYTINIFLREDPVYVQIPFFEQYESSQAIVNIVIILTLLYAVEKILEKDSQTSGIDKIIRIVLYGYILILMVVVFIYSILYNIGDSLLLILLFRLLYENTFLQIIAGFLLIGSIILLFIIFLTFMSGKRLPTNLFQNLFKPVFSFVAKLMLVLSLFFSYLYVIGAVILDDETSRIPTAITKQSTNPEVIRGLEESIKITENDEEGEKETEKWGCYLGKILSADPEAGKCFNDENGESSQKVNTHSIVHLKQEFFESSIFEMSKFTNPMFTFQYKVEDEFNIYDYTCYFKYREKRSRDIKKVDFFNIAQNDWKIGNDKLEESSKKFVVNTDTYKKNIYCGSPQEKLKEVFKNINVSDIEVSFGIDLYVESDVKFLLELPLIIINENVEDKNREQIISNVLTGDTKDEFTSMSIFWTNLLNVELFGIEQLLPTIIAKTQSLNIQFTTPTLILKYSNNHNPVGRLISIEEVTKENINAPEFFNLENVAVTGSNSNVKLDFEVKEINELNYPDGQDLIIEELRINSKAKFLIDENEYSVTLRNDYYKEPELINEETSNDGDDKENEEEGDEDQNEGTPNNGDDIGNNKIN